MKQMLFETRHRADELLNQALEIWRQSDQSDYLEGIEKDPAFSLLMMALSYQSNELDSEVERLKDDVLDDFARILMPYEAGHAIPASAVVESTLQDDVPEMTLGEESVFRLAGEHPFIPLMETRALNASVRSVVRLDGRRWKVTLSFKSPVSDLSLFAFLIKGADYGDLTVSLKGQLLPLVRPWDYADLPFAPCFSPDSLTYNLGQMYRVSSLPMDLFARQNVRYYSIRNHNPQKYIPVESSQLDLVFEFSGISDNFVFDKNCIVLNPVVLVNAQVHEANLSAATPLVRLAGGKDDQKEQDLSARQFLHLIRPLENQVYSNMELEVRGVAGDRFNQGSLVKLINSIITKYRSDFYAFMHLKGPIADDAVHQLETALSRLQEQGMVNALRNVTGVYLMPRGKTQSMEFSLSVKYLTTAGSAVNQQLGLGSVFTAPSGFNTDTRALAVPAPGVDEIRSEDALGTILRYQLLTGDRIVTMADIKLFCQKELMVQYGIGRSMISRMRVNKRLQRDVAGCGYEILAEIVLVGNAFVQRSFADKVPMAQVLLQKMIEVRSANIYPVRVHITIEEEKA